MARRLGALRDTGLAFGFIFTLTLQNLPELEWVARFAMDHGARLLQVHPLELAGRGRTMTAERPDEEELQWAVLEATRLQALVGPSLTIHVDALPARRLRRAQVPCRGSGPFADLVHPLVIESDGTVVPMEHGFDHNWRLGSLYERSLASSIARFRVERLAAFQEEIVLGAAADAAARGIRFVNWHEAVTRRAHDAASGAVSAHREA